jgi:hypothetical protein
MKLKKLQIRIIVIMMIVMGAFGADLHAQTTRFESHNFPGNYIRHAYSRGRIDANVSPFQDSEFRIVSGLANGAAISLESVNFPGSFLRHKSGEIWLEPNDGSGIFHQDATWWMRSGLAGGGVSFESYNFGGNYIRHRNGLLYSESPGGLPADATFHERPVGGGAMVDAFEGADPEITNFDGNYRIYVTNHAGVIRCMRPYDNNNLKGSWYATTAFTMPPHLINGWAPAVVKVGSEYRMYFNAIDTRGPDDNNIYVAFSNNPNSGFANEVEVVHDGAGGCTDVIDAGIDGNIIYYGGSVGGGAFMADLTNNGRSSANHRMVNGLTNYSEAPFVGYVTGVGKVMLYARGFYYNDSYGTNWATGDGQNWTYQGQVNFPNADQYLFRLGHASTVNDYIAVNSNRAGTPVRRIAIGQLSLQGGYLEGNRVSGDPGADTEGMVLTVVIEDLTDVNVVADFGEMKPSDFKIYPNPVQGTEFFIAFNAREVATSAQIDIYDLSGALVLQVIKENVEMGVNSYQLDRSGLRAGQYMLRVTNDRGQLLGGDTFIVK